MIIRHEKPFHSGLNLLISERDPLTLMDFGIVSLKAGERFTCALNKERTLLLIQGEAEFSFRGETRLARRDSFLDENPVMLHLPAGEEFSVMAITDCEFAYAAIENEKAFPIRLYGKDECDVGQFGKGVLNDTSLRDVRTVLDDDIAPHSNLVIGEIINYPGKWSSYPGHSHIQPEIYYYRFAPGQGFGVSFEGEQPYRVADRDTAVIRGGQTHSQTAAPGYAMYYVWVIPHKPRRWLKERAFSEKDAWLTDPNTKIWPCGRDQG